MLIAAAGPWLPIASISRPESFVNSASFAASMACFCSSDGALPFAITRLDWAESGVRFTVRVDSLSQPDAATTKAKAKVAIPVVGVVEVLKIHRVWVR